MRSESAEFHVLWRTCTQGNDFLSLSLNFDAVFQNSTVLDRFEKEVFFCDARKKEKLTHTHTTTFLNVVCVVSRPLPECSLSVVSLVVFQQGSLNTLQLRFFSVVQSLLLGSKHFRTASLLLSHTVTIPIYIFLFRSSLRLWIYH